MGGDSLIPFRAGVYHDNPSIDEPSTLAVDHGNDTTMSEDVLVSQDDTTRATVLPQHRAMRHGCGFASLQDVLYYNDHGRYQARQLDNTIKLFVSRGIYEMDRSKPVTSYHRIMLSASACTTVSTLIAAVGERDWRQNLCHRFPRDFDRNRIVILVRFSEGNNDAGSARPVEVRGRLYTEWSDMQVRYGRDPWYYVDLIYNNTAFFTADR